MIQNSYDMTFITYVDMVCPEVKKTLCLTWLQVILTWLQFCIFPFKS